MDREAIDRQLALGREAAKRGDHAIALGHLHSVVEAEPENEDAWLWLSAVVESDADKRLCLENVLVLNPEHEAARRGLARLAVVDDEAVEPPGQLISRRMEALTPAGAILYPERQQKDWRWHDPIELQQATVGGYSSESFFDDVWQREGELCAYCATELISEDTRCPGCGRRLTETAFRYQRASSDLIIYWVLILGIGVLALATLVFNLLSQGSPASMAWQTLVFLSMMVTVAGLAFRRFWAYVASIVALLLIVAALLLGPSLGPVVDNSISELAGRDFFLRLAEAPYALFIGPTGDILRGMQYLAVLLALFYGIL
ncbi:MAG: hypothetical protein PVH18_07070, partial [Chloroflexota bacterium]